MLKKLLVILFAISQMAFANTNFEYSVSKLLVFEGEKLDKSIGNIHSKYGVTRPTLKRYNGRTDIENLTEFQAKDIIYKLYWLEFGLDRFIDKRSALLVLDFLYNSNPTNATNQIQKAIGNSATGSLSISDVAKINYMGYKEFYKVYSKQRLDYMKSLKVWGQFKNGFKNRVNELGGLQ